MILQKSMKPVGGMFGTIQPKTTTSLVNRGGGSPMMRTTTSGGINIPGIGFVPYQNPAEGLSKIRGILIRNFGFSTYLADKIVKYWQMQGDPVTMDTLKKYYKQFTGKDLPSLAYTGGSSGEMTGVTTGGTSVTIPVTDIDQGIESTTGLPASEMNTGFEATIDTTNGQNWWDKNKKWAMPTGIGLGALITIGLIRRARKKRK